MPNILQNSKQGRDQDVNGGKVTPMYFLFCLVSKLPQQWARKTRLVEYWETKIRSQVYININVNIYIIFRPSTHLALRAFCWLSADYHKPDC